MLVIKFQFTFLIIWMHVVILILINDIFKNYKGRVLNPKKKM